MTDDERIRGARIHADLEKELNRLLVRDFYSKCGNEPDCAGIASLYKTSRSR